MFIRDLIISDTEDALKKAFPHCQIEFGDGDKTFFITVLNEHGDLVQAGEILAALEKAYAEALQNKQHDTTWRQLEVALRQVRKVVESPLENREERRILK